MTEPGKCVGDEQNVYLRTEVSVS